MTLSIDSLNEQTLTLPEELILMLLNEESGYFHQVPGWDLHCAVIGAALAELSMIGRIDTDRDTLILLDATEVGDPELDPILKEIVEEAEQHDAQYWIERLVPRAESIIDSILYRLVRMGILEHHDGEFWTLSQSFSRNSMDMGDGDGTAAMFISSRIRDVLFNDVIPYPREVVIICLLKTCDVLRFIFQLDDEVEARIEAISKIDLIGRAITNAVTQNLAAPLLRRSGLARKIPVVSLTKAAIQSACSQREHARAVRGPGAGVRAGVRDAPSVLRADDCAGGGGDESLGAPARTIAPENQRLFLRLREGLWRIGSAAFPRRGGPLPSPQVLVTGVFSQ